nr:MAG TPA: RNA polymerase II-associated factor 1 [Caudoviricetes sp.]
MIKLLQKNAPKIKHTIAATRLHKAVVRWSDGLLHIYII